MRSKFEDIPPPPEKPDPLECCGSGCVPCILDYYDLKLEEWELKHDCSLREYQTEHQDRTNSAND